MTGQITALVFDFDGTIVDTEIVVYEAWAETFRRAGVEPIDRDLWKGQIGLAETDPRCIDEAEVLCKALGVDALSAQIQSMRRSIRDEMLEQHGPREGVTDWIAAAEAAGIPLAIGSSSPTEWVDMNLRRVGLRDHFEFLSCADPPTPGKPDPAVYLAACAQFDVAPSDALAIEDSHNGVAAAIRAGMRCIAVPGEMTKEADLSAATLRVESLAELAPTDWL